MSSSYTRFVSRVLFPLHERLKGHNTVAVRDWLEQTERLPPEALRQLRCERLQALVQRAAAHVPYYRTMFEASGVRAKDIRAPEDLFLLPFLSKQIIRREADRLKADDAGPLEKASTSGSTGEPLKFWLGAERVSHDIAAKWRATRWWGVDIGDPEMVIWASPIEVTAHNRLKMVRDAMLRSTFHNAKDLSDAGLAQLADALNRENPRMLFGYTAAIARLARYVRMKEVQVKCPNLRVVFVTTEKLLDEQRRDMEIAFGAPVANGYGGRDSGFLAHECPLGGMHITAEDVVLEIVDDSGLVLPHGETGEVVVTHLASGDYPFIRYRTGDIAALDSRSCACGRAMPLIREIQGRSNDVLMGRHGQAMHYTGISHLLKDLAALRSFRVVQEDASHVRVLLLLDKPLTEGQGKYIRSGLLEQLGEDMEVTVEPVGELQPEPSGKHRHIINRMQQERSPG